MRLLPFAACFDKLGAHRAATQTPAVDPVLRTRLNEIKDGVQQMIELGDPLISSLYHVVNCPANSEPCRYECAFNFLT